MSGELTFDSPSRQHLGLCWGYHQCLARGGQADMGPESPEQLGGNGRV